LIEGILKVVVFYKMALPQKQLDELKNFISQIKVNPKILDFPELAFFKDFLLCM
jgi:hypothetical protein